MPIVSSDGEDAEFPLEKCWGWDAAGGPWYRTQPDSAHPAPIAVSGVCDAGGGQECRGWRRTALDTVTTWGPPARCAAAASSHLHAARAGPPPPGCPKHKPGLTAFTAGAAAELELSVGGSDHAASAAAADPSGTSARARLHVRYLSSWAGMGVLELSCARGCACRALRIDASDASERVSVWKVARREATLRLDSSGSARCRLRLLVRNTSRSGGHTFKLGGLALRWGSCHDGQHQVRPTSPVPRQHGLSAVSPSPTEVSGPGRGGGAAQRKRLQRTAGPLAALASRARERSDGLRRRFARRGNG